MADEKKKKIAYVAVNGIDFEKLGRVEPGEAIPDKVDAKTLKDLIDCGDIKIPEEVDE